MQEMLRIEDAKKKTLNNPVKIVERICPSPLVASGIKGDPFRIQGMEKAPEFGIRIRSLDSLWIGQGMILEMQTSPKILIVELNPCSIAATVLHCLFVLITFFHHIILGSADLTVIK